MKIINPPWDWYTFGQARFGSFSSAFSATSLEPSVLPIKSDIDSNNQLEITTTVFSEHRCRIGFYGSKVTCVSAAAPSDYRRRYADSSKHFLATSSSHWFSRIKVHLGVPKVSSGSLLGRPRSTIRRPHDATYPTRPPKTSPKAPEQHPRCPKELPEDPSGFLSAPEGPQVNISWVPRASGRAGGMRGAPQIIIS